MVEMVFMMLYVIAAIATAVAVSVAWKDGVDDCPPIVGIMLVIVVSIGWPILLIGVAAYVAKFGLFSDKEES